MTAFSRLSLLILVATTGPARAQEVIATAPTTKPTGLILPTNNRNLLENRLEEFYQVVDRTFEGVRTQPWEGGQYGFVRTPIRTEIGLVYKQFHEGLDIRPVERDKSDEPQDMVKSMADGKIVHVNDISSRSNYGRYVVVEHDWGYGAFYSLYAHLSDVKTSVGTKVAAGDVLGRMGYTGAGINKERAHVHVELNFLLSSRFNDWHAAGYSQENYHGNYNGMNLLGIDLASFLLAVQSDPNLSIPRFLSVMKPYYEILVPRQAEPLEITRRYPWLLVSDEASPSWQISLTGAGIPLAVRPGKVAVTSPQIMSIVDSPVLHYYRTRGHITGTGTDATFTGNGLRFIQLLTGSFPAQSPRTGNGAGDEEEP